MADYPAWLESTERLPDGRSVRVRPIRPQDWRQLQAGLALLTPEDRHFRFMGGLDTISDDLARRLSTVDYEREIAIVAFGAERDGGPAGLARLAPLGPGQVELAIVVLPGWKRLGLGRLLCERGLAWARRQGIAKVEMLLLAENLAMRRLAEDLGFAIRPVPQEFGVLQGELELKGKPT